MENCESASRFFSVLGNKAWRIRGKAGAMVARLGVHINGAHGPWILLAAGIGFAIFAGWKCYFCPHGC